MLTYGQKTSQDVSYMTSWDETALTQNPCSCGVRDRSCLCHLLEVGQNAAVAFTFSKVIFNRLLYLPKRPF